MHYNIIINYMKNEMGKVMIMHFPKQEKRAKNFHMNIPELS